MIELLSVRSTVCTLLYSLAGCLFRYFLSSFGPKWNLWCFNKSGEKNVIRNIRIWVNLVRRPKATEAGSIHFMFVCCFWNYSLFIAFSNSFDSERKYKYCFKNFALLFISSFSVCYFGLICYSISSLLKWRLRSLIFDVHYCPSPLTLLIYITFFISNSIWGS